MQLKVARVTPSDISDAPPSDDNTEDVGSGSSFESRLPVDPVSKFRKLKDIMWTREAVEDVTAAEFACSVEASKREHDDESLRRPRKRAVDYEKILSNLNRRIADMKCEPIDFIDFDNVELDEDKGMGRFTYTAEERQELLVQVLTTRKGLLEIMNANSGEGNSDAETDSGDGSFNFELPEIRVGIPKEEDSAGVSGPKLYVRDDGTVDWEGALQDRAALRKFGGAVWARINGQTPDDLPDEDEDGDDKNRGNAFANSHREKSAVTAKIQDTPEILAARKELNELEEELKKQTKSHNDLLASGILQGQAVANVRLASLDPELRTKIRLSAEALHTLEQRVSYQMLVYELERIYTYLATSLGDPSAKGYVPLQDRLNVAEYGLLEGQVENCSRELNTKGSLDADILAVIAEQMSDFKRRLGIDYYVTGLTYDKEAIQTWLQDIRRSATAGLLFYIKGCRLFWNDIVYCSSLIARAAQGYTLEPREVRTLRRTFKDIITFIPVVIIWIIPLTPVGHVLVFGAIQRFFPDFFPSCFTEQRQNLLELYETTEFSEFVINENFKEKLTRLVEAGGFLLASKSREFYVGLTTPKLTQTADQSETATNGEKEK